MIIPGSANSLLLSAGASNAYNLTKSLRFRASASAYLNRSISNTTNQKTFTYSDWIKRGQLGTQQDIVRWQSGPNNIFQAQFYNDNIWIRDYQSGNTMEFVTSAVYRDPAAWYHIVFLVDTTQSTSTNRFKLYVNGIQITSFSTSTYPNQNLNTTVNTSGAPCSIGSGNYFDGYMTEINFIDGQALTPSSFGENNADTGVWQPKRYTGTYGTNGFYLPFTNTSSTTTLGYDFSGNGNNYTTNNFSLTAGSTYDSMTDVPTLTSATTANYCVMNPLDKGNEVNDTDGNLSVSWSGVSGHSIRSTVAVSNGKWYCEITKGTSNVTIGLILSNILGVNSANGWPGNSVYGVGGSYAYADDGNKRTNSSSVAYGATYANGDVIGIAFDADAGTLAFYKNGTSQGTAFTSITGLYCFAVGYYGGSTGGTAAYANFGQRPFAYTPPTGYVALNTYNLSAPTIAAGNKYMDATTYTGDGTNGRTITNQYGFKPDFVWIKSRSNALNNNNYDSNRGAPKEISSNLTSAESDGDLTAFASNGFTINQTAGYEINHSGYTYVGWQWQAGQGTTSSNTNGSITSTVSVNPTAGFSVVKYVGAGTTSTVGHGLGVAPAFIVLKDTSSGAYNWIVYHQSIGATGYLHLNLTASTQTSSSGGWNDTAPTSTVFTLGSGNANANTNGNNNIAYCWAQIAGFSAFGSYTGNGSSDGTFVYTGFRPKFVMMKSLDAVGSWIIQDTSRSTYNAADANLYPNLSNAEDSGRPMDLLSNGFKFRQGTYDGNKSGVNYIYAAFAESPFKYALGR